MTSLVPEAVAKKAAQLNDNYNPLAESKQPSEAHGRYIYAKGIVEQAVGEASGSNPYVTDGLKLKAQGAAEIQAARTSVTVEKWHDMLSRGDFGAISAETQSTLDDIGKSTGSVIESTSGGVGGIGRSMSEQGKNTGVSSGEYAGRVVEGVGNIGGGLGKGVGDVTGGVGKGAGGLLGGGASDVGKGVGLGAREDV